jgi:predicted kinase
MKLFHQKEKTIIIVRGTPGAGKTTFANAIAKPWQIFEADQFFTKKGEYKFDGSKLKDAHNWCKKRVHYWMHPSIFGSIFFRKIVVSNTFTQDWEMRYYQIIAKKYGYKVYTIIVENRHGGINTHGVPDDKLEIMHKRFSIK